jgi:hypothetical protein
MWMRFLGVGLGLTLAGVAALPVQAQTIGPSETKAYVGKPRSRMCTLPVPGQPSSIWAVNSLTTNSSP